MTTRAFAPNRWLILGIGLCFAGAVAIGEDGKAKGSAKPATPPPKKKAEHEADEPEAPEPTGDTSKEESYFVVPHLMGIWKTSGNGAEGPKQLTIKTRGLYALSGSTADAGFMTAHLGKYRRRPDKTRKWAEGTYKFQGIDRLETDGPFGKLVWERVK